MDLSWKGSALYCTLPISPYQKFPTPSDDGFLFGNGSDDLCGYVDVDYAEDLESRRSTSGAVFILNGGPISSHSRRQTCVLLSNPESEFIIASYGTKEVIWLRRLYWELGGANLSIPLHCDNQGTIALILSSI